MTVVNNKKQLCVKMKSVRLTNSSFIDVSPQILHLGPTSILCKVKRSYKHNYRRKNRMVEEERKDEKMFYATNKTESRHRIRKSRERRDAGTEDCCTDKSERAPKRMVDDLFMALRLYSMRC